jgi:peptide deformylase
MELEYLSKDLLKNTKPKQIVTDLSLLRVPRKAQEMTNEEIDKVTAELYLTLLSHNGLGLSTPQINSPYRVCIINVKEPLVLVNPEIIKYGSVEDEFNIGKPFLYIESCLSLPKTITKPKRTMRHSVVTIKTDNLGLIEFKPDTDDWETNRESFNNDLGLLESVVVQHEIGHLDGKLIIDNGIRYDASKFSRSVTPNRNEKVMIKSNDTGETKYLKYKFAEKYIKTENYILI